MEPDQQLPGDTGGSHVGPDGAPEAALAPGGTAGEAPGEAPEERDVRAVEPRGGRQLAEAVECRGSDSMPAGSEAGAPSPRKPPQRS